MSNEVEVLLLDGPKHGMMVQTPRPPQPVLEVYADVNSMAFYNTRVMVIADAQYRIATWDQSEFSDDTINMHIVTFGLQPSWDLNRLQEVPL